MQTASNKCPILSIMFAAHLRAAFLVILLPSALVNWRRCLIKEIQYFTMGNTGILTKAGKQRSIATYNASHSHLLNCLLLLHILDLWKEWRPWCYEHRLSKSLFGLAIGQEGKWTHFTCSMPPIVTDQILSRRGIWSMVSLTFTNYENIVLIKRMSFQGMCSFVAIQYCS